MKDISLVIMAAGLGSRFGGDIKQLEKVDDFGHIIMDYSIYDAIEAGFNKVVFIIRRDIEEIFKEAIGNRIEKKIKCQYVFQDIENIPVQKNWKKRKKPWGTGHAVLSAKNVINEPFVVINADDFYGKQTFKLVYDFLTSTYDEKTKFAMAGFNLKNTLSENGAVTRGVAKVDENEFLKKVTETRNIAKKDGKIFSKKDGADCVEQLDENSFVSMNMWGLKKEFLIELESEFIRFLNNVDEGDVESEYLLPQVVDNVISSKKATVKVLPTNDKWFGLTYKADKAEAFKVIEEKIAKGDYVWK